MEFAEQRRDPSGAGGIRCGEAQPAARAALQLADCAFGFIEFARDALTHVEVDVARFGEAELARGPVQQLGAEPGFEILDFAADGGLGQAERAGRGNEAAVFNHADEDEGVVEIACHGGSPEVLGQMTWADWPVCGIIIP